MDTRTQDVHSGQDATLPTKNNGPFDFKNLPSQTKQLLTIGVGIVVLLIVVLIIASSSLPGQALYSVKTNVLEETSQALHFGTKSTAAYQVERLQTRLDELKRITKQESVSEKTLTAFQTQVDKHSATLVTLVTQESAGFTMEERLTTLNSFASVAGAMEVLSESDEKLSALGDHLEDVRRETVNSFKDTVDMFVQSTTQENLFEYIKNQLGTVSEMLNDPDISAETIDDAESYIDRVGPAMSGNDFARAIVATAEALRFIEIERYVGDLIPEEVPQMRNASSTTATTTMDYSSTTLDASTTTTVPEVQ